MIRVCMKKKEEMGGWIFFKDICFVAFLSSCIRQYQVFGDFFDKWTCELTS